MRLRLNSGGLPTSTDGEWIDWPLETYQEIWGLYKKAEQSYRSPKLPDRGSKGIQYEGI